MPITIRTAAADDVPALASLAGELGYPTPISEMTSRLTRLSNRVDHSVFVAVDQGTVVGWIHVCIVQSLESAPFAEICGLIVADAQRSRGIGGQLVAAAEQWAAQQACATMRVRSNVLRTRSRQFYERSGYAVRKTQNVFDKPLDV